MPETWKKMAIEIGVVIQKTAAHHPQLNPLYSAYMNYAQKHRIQQPSSVDPVLVQLTSIVNYQVKKIAALELRIKQLKELH